MLSRFIPFGVRPPLDKYQRCLQYSFFNTITWQMGLGTPLLIFAEKIGASSGQIGLLASLVLLLTPLQILSTALLPIIGYKRLMLAGWGIRTFMLLTPIVIAGLAWCDGPRGWMPAALVATIFGFCLFRSIALVANLPWFYDIIPSEVRGRYFSSESSMVGTASILIMIVSAATFTVLPIFPALALQYVFAVSGSVWSWFALLKLPDSTKPHPSSLAVILGAVPRLVFVRSDFSRYFGLSLGYWIITAPINTFITYHLVAEVQISSGWIMTLEILRYVGMVFAAQWIHRRIDGVGARPYMLISLVLYMSVAVYWLVRLNGHLDNAAGLIGSYLLLGIAATTWAVGNSKYLPKIAQSRAHAILFAVYGSGTALSGGLATLAWGAWMHPGGARTGLDHYGFLALFACLLVGAGLISLLLTRKPEPDADPAEPLMLINTVLRPWRAAAYLINLTEPLPDKPEESASD
jgi:hypothetical protein